MLLLWVCVTILAHSANLWWREEFYLPSIDCMDATKHFNTNQTE
ncbi:unnamed protein product [Brassica rapa]|uniref:Uncharacterized protein n=1 Tax=Brassica campestris TaxID=3711 RepID=A0A8D9CSL1_BRACM|nr:unnamed protein product [Brassica rapa]